MAKVTFDGATKRIIVNPGVTAIDVEGDLYSEWKRWLLESDNAKYLQAFRTFGGDETIIGQTAPKYFFVLNGWKVVIDGFFVTFATNLYQQDGGDPFIVLNNGGFTNSTSDSPTVSLQGGAPTAQEIYDFFMSKDAFNKDANIVSVQSIPVTSINDFKADVDLSTIPQSVWTYITRELTVTAGLTPAQEAKIDQLLIDVNERQDANITAVNGVNVTSIDDFKAETVNVDLSGIPQAVWTYVSRELTVAAGLTPTQEATLNQILSDVNGTLDANIVSVTGTAVQTVDDFKATQTTVDLSGIPEDVWSYATRALTVASGLTQSEKDELFSVKPELLAQMVIDQSAILSDIQTKNTALASLINSVKVDILTNILSEIDSVQTDISTTSGATNNQITNLKNSLETMLNDIDIKVETIITSSGYTGFA